MQKANLHQAQKIPKQNDESDGLRKKKAVIIKIRSAITRNRCIEDCPNCPHSLNCTDYDV